MCNRHISRYSSQYNYCKMPPLSTTSSPTPIARRFSAPNLRPYGRAIFAPKFTLLSAYMLTLISRSTTVSKTYRNWVLSLSPFLIYFSWGYFGAFLGTGEGQKTLYEDRDGILQLLKKRILQLLLPLYRHFPYHATCPLLRHVMIWSISPIKFTPLKI